MKISYSELDSYRQCRFKHQLGYHERWKPEKPSAALEIGSLFHTVMEHHYANLGRGEKGVRAAVEAVGAALGSAGATEEMTELVKWMYEGYVQKWLGDAGWEIVATEEWIEIDLGEGVIFHGKIDLQVRWMGDLWIVDHKTCKDLPSDLELDLDDQLGLYVWGKQQQGVKIRGGIQNSIRKQRNKSPMRLEDRFARQITFRTEHELSTMAKEARELALEANLNRGPGDRPRSPTPDRCRWRCDFTEACLHGRKYGSTAAREFLSETGYKQETDEERQLRRERLGSVS